MFNRWLKQVKQDEEGGGEGGGAGGGDDFEVRVAAEVKKRIETEVAGLKNKNSELLGSLAKYKETLSKYDGIEDPAKIKELLKNLESSEEARLIAEGKADEVWAKRNEKKDAEVARQLKERDDALAAAKESTAKYMSKVLQNEIRAAAPSDVHPSALTSGDILRHAMEVFELDSDGNAVPKDGKYGKDGKSLYTLKEWFEDDRQASPHRYTNQNSGSGDFNKGSKNGSGKTMSREKFDSLKPHEKGQVIKDGIHIVDR